MVGSRKCLFYFDGVSACYPKAKTVHVQDSGIVGSSEAIDQAPENNSKCYQQSPVFVFRNPIRASTFNHAHWDSVG